MSLLTQALLATLAALLTSGFILATQLWLSRRRRRRFGSLELLPNILMTRFPLMFVGRRRSLFRVDGDFLELPMYLSEHGFQVDEVEIDVRKHALSLSTLLDSCQTPVHMIVSEAFAKAAYDLAFEGHSKISTLTIFGRGARASTSGIILRPTRNPVFERPELKPSPLATTFAKEQIALGHMVSLAEHDLR